MRIAINNQGLLTTAEQVASGILRSNEYSCPRCAEVVFFVSGSSSDCSVKRCNHFRHKPESTCEFKDVTSESCTNKMSDFHVNWQALFPKKYLERRISNHYADVYLTDPIKEIDIIVDKDSRMFCSNTSPIKSLIIEIQNSPISAKDLMDRQKCYTLPTRQLLWIFNISEARYEIEHINTGSMNIHRLKFYGDASFMRLLCWEHRANILLDNGGNCLYRVSNKHVIVDQEFIDIKLINRDAFLKQISNIFGLQLSWTVPLTPSHDIVVYDYEKAVSLCPNISASNRHQIMECFHMMEVIPFRYFMGSWKYCVQDKLGGCLSSVGYGFTVIGEILDALSSPYGFSTVITAWMHWVLKNKPMYQEKMTFGKYKGTEICNIPVDYLDYILENDIPMYDQEVREKIHMLCEFSRSKLSSLCSGTQFPMNWPSRLVCQYSKEFNIRNPTDLFGLTPSFSAEKSWLRDLYWLHHQTISQL